MADEKSTIEVVGKSGRIVINTSDLASYKAKGFKPVTCAPTPKKTVKKKKKN
jgi:hypothetical protein